MSTFEVLVTAMVPVAGGLSVMIDRWISGRREKNLNSAKTESLNVQTTRELVETVQHELHYYTEQLAQARVEIANLSTQVNALQQMVRDLGGDPNLMAAHNA